MKSIFNIFKSNKHVLNKYEIICRNSAHIIINADRLEHKSDGSLVLYNNNIVVCIVSSSEWRHIITIENNQIN